MSYYEDDSFAGNTDGSGNAKISIDYLSTRNVHFLGYVVLNIACTLSLQNKRGKTIAAAAGLLPCAGPMLHTIGDTHFIVLTGAAPNAAFTATLVGDANEDPEQLVVRPQPTQAGQALSGVTTLPQIIATGPLASDFQAGITVEGAAQFQGPDPLFDITHPSFAGGGRGDGSADTGPFNAVLAKANVRGGVVLFPVGGPANGGTGNVGLYAVGATSTITAAVYLWGPGATIKLINQTNLPVLQFTGTGGGILPGLTIDGNRANQSAGGAAGDPGVYINHGSKILVDAATIINTFNEGVFGDHATRCQIRNTTITGCNIAVHWLNVSNDNLIEGGTYDANDYGLYVDYNGLLANACYRNRIIGVTVTGCTGTNQGLGQAAGIAIRGCYRTMVVGADIDGGTQDVIRGLMILVGDFNDVANVNVTSAGHNGFDITGNFNNFAEITSELSQQAGFFLSGPSSFNIGTGMVLVANGQRGGVGGRVQAGLVVNWGNPGNVADNVFKDIISTDNGAGTQLYGILEWTAGVAANYLRNRFEGGNLTGNVTAGVGPLISVTSTYRNLQGFNPQGTVGIAVGASPFTYTNNDNVDELIYIYGGTLSAVTKDGNGIWDGGPAGQKGDAFSCMLSPTESIVCTYTGLFNMLKDRK